jgi:hypothetical protein
VQLRKAAIMRSASKSVTLRSVATCGEAWTCSRRLFIFSIYLVTFSFAKKRQARGRGRAARCAEPVCAACSPIGSRSRRQAVKHGEHRPGLLRSPCPDDQPGEKLDLAWTEQQRDHDPAGALGADEPNTQFRTADPQRKAAGSVSSRSARWHGPLPNARTWIAHPANGDCTAAPPRHNFQSQFAHCHVRAAL